MKTHLSLILIIACLCFVSCTPDDTIPTESLYVVGLVYDDVSQTGMAAYWQNGVQKIIPGSERVRPISIDIIDGQINITWLTFEQRDNRYFNLIQVWKEDGTITDINTEISTFGIDAFEANNDLYVVGIERESDITPGRPVYWKNGIKIALPMMPTGYVQEVQEMTLRGNEVVGVGSFHSTDGFIRPLIWENGTVQELPLGTYEGGSASSISIDDGITYIGGSVYDRETEREYMAIWTNGELEVIVTDEEYRRIGITKMRVVNGDRVYTGWKVDYNRLYEAFYYEAGERVILSNDPENVNYLIDELIFDGRNIITMGQSNSFSRDLPAYSFSINGVHQTLAGLQATWINDVLLP
ncbi:hypothetical protein [Roseivirga sp.]|uniref:hypothetical protein n=1 Tax=Roseivirga sp. TaxID=1964215 RepID=UPI003B8C9757